MTYTVRYRSYNENGILSAESVGGTFKTITEAMRELRKIGCVPGYEAYPKFFKKRAYPRRWYEGNDEFTIIER